MQRKAQSYLKVWFKAQDRCPLLLRGARQVGKSTLVRLFCKAHQLDLFEINLEKQKLMCVQQDNISLNSLMIEVEDLLQKSFDPNNWTQASSLPISTFEDQSVFKLFFLDIGLVLTSQKISWEQLNQKFSDLNQIGPLHEQFIAQHLMFRSSGFEEPHLNYWLKDKTTGKAEIDFLFQEGLNIFPIEVKAGASGSLKSLWQFIKEKKVKYAIQFYSDQYITQNFTYSESDNANTVELKFIKCPHYLVGKIIKIITQI